MFNFIKTPWKRFTGNRFAQTSMFISLVVASALLANAKEHASPSEPPPTNLPQGSGLIAIERPRIEAVFVLDTTGSMSGLINGAKQKIWSIVNQMSNANITPEIKIGLIGYRDRGDQYVTNRFDLTNDIDALYGNLQHFEAQGGGDTPESVNQALHEAVTRMSWSRDQDVYRVVFLVGDAPPHMDYRDDVPYPRSVEMAAAKGIYINTIQCGKMSETREIFASIAKLGGGQFASISQDGAMVATHTPMDEELAKLNVALAKTVVTYGAESDKKELKGKVGRMLKAAPSAVASRLSYFSKHGGKTNSGRADLVAALDGDEVALSELSTEELPTEMQAMNASEREKYVRTKALKRSEIKSKIVTLAESRDEYLEKSSIAREAEGKDDAFDDRLLGTIRTQAADKGIVY